MKIAKISELQAIQCGESGEPLVDLKEVCPDIRCEYRRHDSDLNRVLVRQTVAEKLIKVQRSVSKQGMGLLVVEGYRSLMVQERYFMKQLLLYGDREWATWHALSKLLFSVCDKPFIFL